MRAVRYSAAGGIVVDQGRILVLRRPSRDEVRLPKGHIERGESPESAALREVAEESGYVGLQILADLGTQVVEFDYGGTHVIREEHYFLMASREQGALARPIERAPKELQFSPEWLDWETALSQLTFEVEREWVRRARAQWKVASHVEATDKGRETDGGPS